ncbi:MAG: ABC transporter ATP-binding protein [Acidobacteriia bacterium]|nr:ABC transporter ATP-binding protein [Terriglobia bacterium]
MAELLQLELRIRYGDVTAVDSARLDVRTSEIVVLAGESGSGKSSIALAILGVMPSGAALEGSVRFAGQELLGMKAAAIRAMRARRLAYIPQDASACLSPWKTIRRQLWTFWKLSSSAGRGEFDRALAEALESVALSSSVLDKYPAQLSVGQCQRVAIANAILRRPELIIADEPTSALDMITANEIIQLFAALRRRGTAVLLISHDLSLAATIADRIAILHQGRIVEFGAAQEVLESPAHPYTRALLAAMPETKSTPRSHGVTEKDEKQVLGIR